MRARGGITQLALKMIKSHRLEERGFGRFSSDQLDKLRAEYSTITTMDPSQPAYNQLTNMLDGLDNDTLVQLTNAKINFISSLALNRAARTGVGIK